MTMKSPAELEALKSAILMLSMNQEARDVLAEMDLADAKHVATLTKLLKAGAMSVPNTLHLLTKLQEQGLKPSRDMLEELAEAVRAHPAPAA